MPENFEIAHIWILGLFPLPLLIYWLVAPLRIKSASLLFPNLKKAQEYTRQKARKSAHVKRRNIFAWSGLVLIWLLLVVAVSSPQLVGEPEMKVKTSRNFLIVADEVYQLLAYTATPPAPMISFDQAGTVLSLGSFSKILAPGLRLGWIQAGDEFLRRLAGSGLLLSGGGLNPFTASVVQSALELSLQDEHLTHLKKIYRHGHENSLNV